MVDERSGIDVAALVDAHYQTVYRYAYRLSGSVADAEDLTQEVFLIAQEKLGQLQRPASAQAWLLAIVRTCFLKDRQRRRPVPCTSLDIDIQAIATEVPPDAAIDGDRLQEAIGQLPPPFRVVLVMYYFEGYSYRQIAEELELPIGTVMSRLARAKGYVRARLFAPRRPGGGRRQPSAAR